MVIRAEINPKVFEWTRETARTSIEAAAKKISVSVERIKEWESGKAFPTIRQAQALAKAYRRPFALFFLNNIPTEFIPIKDFRTTGSQELGTGVVFIIREVQQQQTWISEVTRTMTNRKPSLLDDFRWLTALRRLRGSISLLNFDEKYEESGRPSRR